MTASPRPQFQMPPPEALENRKPLTQRADGLLERTVYLMTQSGQMQTFVVHPENGGPHPVVLLYMDAVGYRQELKNFARRFARNGYYAVLPNLYYRDGGPSYDPWDPSTLTPWMLPLAYELSNANVMADTATVLDFVAADPAARPGPKGVIGYCMGGRMALGATGTFPDHFTAAATLYGGRQVTEEPDSPHLVALRTKGEIYVAYAGIDKHVPQAQRDRLAAAFAQSGIAHTIELIPGVVHGFAFPERHVYNEAAAERTWTFVLDMFARRVGQMARG
jgi:carboxymethylenebutenolidase